MFVHIYIIKFFGKLHIFGPSPEKPFPSPPGRTKNGQALGELPDVDGFLVGGASLKPTFTERRLLLKVVVETSVFLSGGWLAVTSHQF